MTQTFRHRALTALALAASILPATAIAQAKPAPISEAEVRSHIAQLASDAFEGRGPGSAGETKTLDYLAKTWASYGLVSGTNDAAHPWFQPEPFGSMCFMMWTVCHSIIVMSEPMLMLGPYSMNRFGNPAVVMPR